MANLWGSALADTAYLERRNGHPTWHCVKDVPRTLRARLGKSRLVKSLETHDLKIAQAKRWKVLADFQRILDAASGQGAPNAAIEGGLAWRDTLARIEAGDPATIAVHGGNKDTGWWDADPDAAALTPQEKARRNVSAHLDIEADELAAGDADEADTFRAVAFGDVTPLLHHVDSWLAEGGARGPVRDRTKGQYRTDVNRLDAWAKRAGVPATVEAFTRKVAGRYVSEELVSRGVDPKTANRQISAASTYWRWLMKRAGIEANPWEGQRLGKVGRKDPGEKAKRPFTASEVLTLLMGDADAELADAMRVAALSGMRIEEVYRLTVARCADGWFDIRDAKTPAGWRRVPIHSALESIVAQRVKGKGGDDFLFHEPGPARPGRERSMATSKRFGTYRRGLKVHERKEGRRQSAVDFHSWRRWFITAARNAGFDQPTVAAVVGHEAGNITDDVYSGGPSEDVRRRLVEAVKLPTC